METAVTSIQDQLEEVDEGPAAADVPPPPPPREGDKVRADEGSSGQCTVIPARHDSRYPQT